MADITLARVERVQDALRLDKMVGATAQVPAAEPVRFRILDAVGRRRIKDAVLHAELEVPQRAGILVTKLRDRRTLDAPGDLVFHIIGFPPGRHTVRFHIDLDVPSEGGMVERVVAGGTLTVVAE